MHEIQNVRTVRAVFNPGSGDWCFVSNEEVEQLQDGEN